jgi:SAM-dependent methyltransferase
MRTPRELLRDWRVTYFEYVRSNVHDQVRTAIADTLALDAGTHGRLLDVGCWDGGMTIRYGRALGVPPERLHGVDSSREALETARERFAAELVDLEAEPLPYDDGVFTHVVCNQVLEHLKQVHHAMDEMWRVLAPGGLLLLSVPNLSSLHNRLLLAAGRQPTSIRVMGPHVRGFALAELHSFLRFSGRFSLERSIGVGLYPLPEGIARPLARIFPSLSHTPLQLARKADPEGPSWGEQIRTWSQTEFA